MKRLTLWEAFLWLHALFNQFGEVVQLFSRLPQVHCAALRQAYLILHGEKSPYKPKPPIY